MGDTEEASFTVLDEMVLRSRIPDANLDLDRHLTRTCVLVRRLLSEHVGGLWRKCETYDQVLACSVSSCDALHRMQSRQRASVPLACSILCGAFVRH
eukprot:2241561-Rhodomonas_salina.7